MPTFWEVLTELILPLLIAGGTIAIAVAFAVVAARTTRQLALREEADEQRRERATLAAAIDDYVTMSAGI